MIKKRTTQVFLGLMALAFCKTGIESLLHPQAVMANVGIVLDNTSALSSMRAIYGGMHFIFGCFCLYGLIKDYKTALVLIILYTAGFVIGRVSGLLADGAPNQFVMTWLVTEFVSGAIALILLLWNKKEELR